MGVKLFSSNFSLTFRKRPFLHGWLFVGAITVLSACSNASTKGERRSTSSLQAAAPLTCIINTTGVQDYGSLEPGTPKSCEERIGGHPGTIEFVGGVEYRFQSDWIAGKGLTIVAREGALLAPLRGVLVDLSASNLFAESAEWNSGGGVLRFTTTVAPPPITWPKSTPDDRSSDAEQNRETLDAGNLGAYPDGTHPGETYAALQLALAAAASTGQEVYLPEGTYLLDRPLIASTGISIRGSGRGRTILRYTYEQQANDAKGLQSALIIPDGTARVRLSDFTLQYVGAFDTGLDGSGINQGKICGVYAQGVKDMQVNGVEICGFNACGILFDQGSAPSEQILVSGCELHHNRVAGLWHYAVDGLRVTGCVIHHNGLATDPGTGYGIAANSRGIPSSNVLIDGNIVYCNKRKGIDHHTIRNVRIEDNILFGDDTPGLGDQIVGIYVGEAYGAVLIKRNHLRGFADRGLSASYVVSAIEVGWPRGGRDLLPGPLRVDIQENEVVDFDVRGGAQAGLPILIHNDYARIFGRIAGNTLKLGNVGAAISIAESSAESALANKWEVDNNEISIEQLDGGFAARVYQITDGAFRGNHVQIGASSSRLKSVVGFGATAGLTSPKLAVSWNSVEAPDDRWTVVFGAYRAEEYGNVVNGAPENPEARSVNRSPAARESGVSD